ncbi:MAG: arginine deiminase-related protein [Pseudomonadota bacterium]
MIVDHAEQFERAVEQLEAAAQPAVPRGLFVIEPANFQLSAQSSRDNSYMNLDAETSQTLALQQHRGLAAAIVSTGVPLLRFPGSHDQPDDIFPNNVFGTAQQRLIIGSMRHPDRQKEVDRTDIRSVFTRLMGYDLVDLSQRDLIAELTGALVIDRARSIGFCGMSPRVDRAGSEAMHDAFGLSLTYRFALKPEEYHTNVVMSVLASRALIICPDAFADAEAPAAIARLYPERVLEISSAEKNAFAGNCLAITDRDLMISATAWRALAKAKRDRLRDWGFTIHAVEMSEIEKSGGSLRCCLAEIF